MTDSLARKERPMTRSLRFLVVTALAVSLGSRGGPAGATPQPAGLVPARILLVRSGSSPLVRFVAKPATTFQLPNSMNDPRINDATLEVFDVASSLRNDTYALAKLLWIGLGNPLGSAGFRYKGTGSIGDPCRVVIIKP